MSDLDLVATSDLLEEIASRCDGFSASLVRCVTGEDAEFTVFQSGSIDLLHECIGESIRYLSERVEGFLSGDDSPPQE